MKRSLFAVTVLAVALPTLAMAADPVPMTDSDMDAIVAGQSFGSLAQVNAAIRANPEQFRALAARNSAIYFRNEATVRKLLDDDLEYLLPPHN